MIFKTLKAARSSLNEFVPALRAKHCLVQLLSGKWTRTLGQPGRFEDAIGRDIRSVHVRGNVYRLMRT